MKSSVKTDFVLPIAVLVVICLVVSALLAVTNFVTDPIITQGDALRAEEARREALPQADSFTLLDSALIPADSMVTEIYRADNGAGYVFMITSTGYGGKDTLNLICAVDNAGTIVSTKVLSHAETAGLGSKITEDDFAGQFPGKDAALEGVDTISGATKSSNYYINAIRSAMEAYGALAG